MRTAIIAVILAACVPSLACADVMSALDIAKLSVGQEVRFHAANPYNADNYGCYDLDNTKELERLRTDTSALDIRVRDRYDTTLVTQYVEFIAYFSRHIRPNFGATLARDFRPANGSRSYEHSTGQAAVPGFFVCNLRFRSTSAKNPRPTINRIGVFGPILVASRESRDDKAHLRAARARHRLRARRDDQADMLGRKRQWRSSSALRGQPTTEARRSCRRLLRMRQAPAPRTYDYARPAAPHPPAPRRPPFGGRYVGPESVPPYSPAFGPAEGAPYYRSPQVYDFAGPAPVFAPASPYQACVTFSDDGFVEVKDGPNEWAFNVQVLPNGVPLGAATYGYQVPYVPGGEVWVWVQLAGGLTGWSRLGSLSCQ